MSLAEAADGGDQRRRGGRSRKQVERYDPTAKRRDDAEGSDSDLTDPDESDDDAQPVSRGKRKAANGTRKAAPPKKRKAAAKVAPTDTVPDVAIGFKTDSPMFNALLQPNVALQPLVEDWVHAYQGASGDEEAEKAAVHELVLFFVRACGLSADVDENEAMDQDGVADTIERIQDESVKTNAAMYPLISRIKALRPFKSNLSTIIQTLIETLYLTPILFDDADTTKHTVPLMPLLFTWLHSMSSSPLRPIRHTGTFIALKVTSALSQVAATASNELSLKQRQKEAEAKKGGSTAAAKRRIAEAEEKVKEAHERKARIEEYMDETDTVLFVHRVRDADPAIRTDCIRELGVWVKRYPEMFLRTSVFSHFARGSNDPDGNARLETVKALSGIFSSSSPSSNASSFSLRIAPRLIQMATLDVEVPVRTHAISVLTQIDKTGSLEDAGDELREKIARLIFDEEPKIRKATAAFVRAMWEERAEKLKSDFNALRDGKKKRAAKVKGADLDQRFDSKALAQLLVETSQSLDTADEQEAGSSKQPAVLAVNDSSKATTRAAAAADALYSQIDLLQDWHALVDYLLLDHSTSESDPWLLTEEEEDFMLDVLIACIRREDDDEDDEKTKALMKVLPRLFTKHQTEVSRIVGILSIPEHMNLALYLDMRKNAAYEALWDDVTKQFLQQTDAAVLSSAIQAINTLTANKSMETTNKDKLTELEESLFASLRDAVDGADVPSMSIAEDQLTTIEAILLRISLLARSRDIVPIMQDEEGGQSSGWAIVLAFAGRGGLGYKEEAKLVEHALQILFLHATWLFKTFTEADAENEDKVVSLRDRRNEAVEMFESYGVRDRTNAAESVRRQAFIAFTNMHILYSARGHKLLPAAKVAALDMKSDKQHKLGGAFTAAVERYASDLEETSQDDDDEELSLAEAQREFMFVQLVSVFVGAIRCGVIDVEQAKEPLAHYGRFGTTYDAIVKKLVDVLRDEGIYNNEATTVQHVVAEALKNSFTIFLESDDEDDEPEATIALARIAATAFVVQGTHFTVIKQINAEDVYDMHTRAIAWLFEKVSLLNRQQGSSKDKDVKTRIAGKRAKLLTYFKPLSLLLGPIAGQNALRIRNYLEEKINSCGAPNETRASASYRLYEKRLVGIAGKDPDLKVQQRRPEPRKSNKSTEIVEDSDASDEEVDDAPPSQPVTSQPIDSQPDDSQETAIADSINGTQESNDSDPATNGSKRQLPEDDDDLPDLDLSVGTIGMDDIDLAFTDTPARDRSESVEPTAKRRKTVTKY